ncbi:Mitogen-activated protein kinase kinase kinase ANP1 [Diplonema papillatum]|nr:Mitogen-activated protein kinase kinase kinase ANP1 [Diplonema papillatum]
MRVSEKLSNHRWIGDDVGLYDVILGCSKVVLATGCILWAAAASSSSEVLPDICFVLAIVLGVVAGCMGIAARLAAEAFDDIARDLRCLASVDFDDALNSECEVSCFTELKAIQGSVASVVTTLRHCKPFLPDAVVNALHPSRGDVCEVDTDEESDIMSEPSDDQPESDCIRLEQLALDAIVPHPVPLESDSHQTSPRLCQKRINTVVRNPAFPPARPCSSGKDGDAMNLLHDVSSTLNATSVSRQSNNDTFGPLHQSQSMRKSSYYMAGLGSYKFGDSENSAERIARLDSKTSIKSDTFRAVVVGGENLHLGSPGSRSVGSAKKEKVTFGQSFETFVFPLPHIKVNDAGSTESEMSPIGIRVQRTTSMTSSLAKGDVQRVDSFAQLPSPAQSPKTRPRQMNFRRTSRTNESSDTSPHLDAPAAFKRRKSLPHTAASCLKRKSDTNLRTPATTHATSPQASPRGSFSKKPSKQVISSSKRRSSNDSESSLLLSSLSRSQSKVSLGSSQYLRCPNPRARQRRKSTTGEILEQIRILDEKKKSDEELRFLKPTNKMRRMPSQLLSGGGGATPSAAPAADPSGLLAGGMKKRKGTILSVEFGILELIAEDGNETYQLASRLVRIALDIVKQAGGNVFQLQADGLLASWGINTRNPRHAWTACHAALAIRRAMESLCLPGSVEGVGWSVAVVGGYLYSGMIGTETNRSPFLLSPIIDHVKQLNQLSRVLQTPILISEAVQDMLGGQLKSRPVDVVEWDEALRPEMVFELMLETDKASRHVELWKEAFSDFISENYEKSLEKMEAVWKLRKESSDVRVKRMGSDMLPESVKTVDWNEELGSEDDEEDSKDLQTERFIWFIKMAMRDGADNVPKPYRRRLLGWEEWSQEWNYEDSPHFSNEFEPAYLNAFESMSPRQDTEVFSCMHVPSFGGGSVDSPNHSPCLIQEEMPATIPLPETDAESGKRADEEEREPGSEVSADPLFNPFDDADTARKRFSCGSEIRRASDDDASARKYSAETGLSSALGASSSVAISSPTRITDRFERSSTSQDTIVTTKVASPASSPVTTTTYHNNSNHSSCSTQNFNCNYNNNNNNTNNNSNNYTTTNSNNNNSTSVNNNNNNSTSSACQPPVSGGSSGKLNLMLPPPRASSAPRASTSPRHSSLPQKRGLVGRRRSSSLSSSSGSNDSRGETKMSRQLNGSVTTQVTIGSAHNLAPSSLRSNPRSLKGRRLPGRPRSSESSSSASSDKLTSRRRSGSGAGETSPRSFAENKSPKARVPSLPLSPHGNTQELPILQQSGNGPVQNRTRRSRTLVITAGKRQSTSGSSPTTPMAPLRKPHEMLEDAIKQAGHKKDDFNSDQDSSSSSDSDDPPQQFTDGTGTMWIRSSNKLGEGAFGQVWLGMCEEGSLVALKCMKIPKVVNRGKKKQSAINESLASAVNEVAMLSKYKDESIVCFLSCGVRERWVIITMEYVSGGSLASVLEQFKTIPLHTAKRYTKDILRGLDYLHSNGIVHRDLKPGNVLLHTDGQCKLSDFGTCTELSAIASNGKMEGTPLFMAPEACRGQPCYASDIWSLGHTVIQMLLGQTPFQWAEEVPKESQRFMRWLCQENAPVPLPPRDKLSDQFAFNFISACLVRIPLERPGAEKLLFNTFVM